MALSGVMGEMNKKKSKILQPSLIQRFCLRFLFQPVKLRLESEKERVSMTVNEKLNGLKDQVAGKLKETEGKLTNDSAREAEGKAQGFFGKTKGKVADAKDAVLDKVDELKKDK